MCLIFLAPRRLLRYAGHTLTAEARGSCPKDSPKEKPQPGNPSNGICRQA